VLRTMNLAIDQSCIKRRDRSEKLLRTLNMRLANQALGDVCV